MIALLRQLSKLLLLVFNLPQVLQLLTQLFKVEEKDGKIELGVVNVIAQTLAQQDVQELTVAIEEGKEVRRAEVEKETDELINTYQSIEDEESREYFIQQAQARKRRVLQDIRNTNPQDILTDDFIKQSVEAKKKQLEPSIVPALTPITALLGIPTMLLKMQEYIPGFSPPNLTDKDTADGVAGGLTSDLGAGGEIFDGPVGEGDLTVEFKGATNNQDFYLYATPEDRDYLALYVTQPAGSVRAFVANHGEIDPILLNEVLTIEVSSHTNPVVNLQLDRLRSGDGPFGDLLEEIYEDRGANKETQILLKIVDQGGSSTNVQIPILLSTRSEN